MPLRVKYRLEQKDVDARKEMATTEFNAWNSYFKARKNEIKKLDKVKERTEANLDRFEKHHDTRLHFSHKIPDHGHAHIREWFDRFKDRKTHRIASKDITTFHGEFAQKQLFPVPLHPKNLSQITHPFHGYLGAYPETTDFSLEELLKIYENQIASSYEKTFGMTLLGEEISCLAFW